MIIYCTMCNRELRKISYVEFQVRQGMILDRNRNEFPIIGAESYYYCPYCRAEIEKDNLKRFFSSEPDVMH